MTTDAGAGGIIVEYEAAVPKLGGADAAGEHRGGEVELGVPRPEQPRRHPTEMEPGRFHAILLQQGGGAVAGRWQWRRRCRRG